MIPATISAAGGILIIAICIAVFWITAATMVASYGRELGYPFVPLLLCSVFLSWAIVLLAVAVAGGKGRSQLAGGVNLGRPEVGA